MQDGIFVVKQVRPSKDGSVESRVAGRLLVRGGAVRHAEDYLGLLSGLLPEGRATPQHALHFARLAATPTHRVERWAAGEGELPPAQLPQLQPTALLRPRPVFHYQRAGMRQPHVLEADGDLLLLEGQPLSPAEARVVAENIRAGRATLRYAPQPQTRPVAKAEEPVGDELPEELRRDLECPALWNRLRPAQGEHQVELQADLGWLASLDWRQQAEATAELGRQFSDATVDGQRVAQGTYRAACGTADKAALAARRLSVGLDELPLRPAYKIHLL